MIALLLAAVMTPVSYQLPLDKPLTYNAEIQFNGFIPMLGGMEAKVDVNLGFKVQAVEPEDGNPRVTNDLVALELKIDGAPLPFTVDSAKQYFPKNTITITPQGKVLKNDAKEIPLPVRLPGLDVKRIPDITFIPIEFPAEGIEVGKEFSFKKLFGDSEVTYKVTPKAVADDKIDLAVELNQTYELLEDESKNVVQSEKDAVARVKTTLSGKGTVVFDRKLNLARSTQVTADAVSEARDLKTNEVSKRQLQTVLKVTLKG